MRRVDESGSRAGARPEDVRVPDSTLSDLEERPQRRLAVWGRRGFLGLLLVVVLAGLAGLLGVRQATATESSNGWTLSVEHASIARAGLDVPWRVTVEREGGFDRTITLAVTGDYFDIYETQGFAPEPSASTRDGELLYLTFDTADGDTFTVSYDAYIQPSSQRGRAATVSVVDEHLVPQVSVEINTFLLP